LFSLIWSAAAWAFTPARATPAPRARRKFGWPWKSRRRGPSPAQY